MDHGQGQTNDQTSKSGVTDLAGDDEDDEHKEQGHDGFDGERTASVYLTTQTDPLGATTSYTYNPAGELSNVVNSNGASIDCSYTPDGEMSQIALPGGVTDNYTYDAFGELTGASNVNATDTFAYDAAGDIVTQAVAGPTQPTDTLNYSYDASANRVSMTGPGGTVHYTYDAANQLVSETDPAGHAFGMSYSANGQLTSLDRPNGVNDALTYAPGGNLTDLVASTGGPALAEASYTYDAAGQRTNLSTTTGSTSYTYDTNHELTGAGSTTYSYNAAGNRTGTGYNYNAADQMLTSPGATYTYDADGNRTSRTDASGQTAYTWDPLNELTSITYPDGTASSYKYDALGRRVQVTDGSTVSRYLYDGDNVVASYDGTNTLDTGYLNGLGTDSLLEITRGVNVYYPVQDGSNDVVALTDSTGAVVETYSYDAYGAQTATGSVTQPFTFTGREFDAKSGLYYYRARYYDPTTGTFLSEDPSIGGNPYSYALDAPTNYIDPTGGEAITEEAFLSLETDNLNKAQAFQKLNACLGGQLLLLALAMEGYAITPPDETALVSRAFANAYTSFLPSQLQGVAQHFINSGNADAASQDGGSSWETKVQDKIKEKVQDTVKEKVEGKVADWLDLPEGTTDFVNGLVNAENTAQSVADAANAVAAGDCATAVKLINGLCAP
jgi:RHS repeat-associated protein